MVAVRALGWLFGLIGLFLLLAFGAAYGFLDEPPMWVNGVGGGGVVLVAFFFWSNWSALQAFGQSAAAAKVVTALFAGVLAGGVAVAANVVAHRYDKRWDLTENKRFTLAQQSIDIVQKLDREISVVGFFRPGFEQDNFADLMKRYQEHTTLLKVSYYDPYANPALAEQYEITTDQPTVILQVGDNKQRLDSSLDEESFTNALVRATSDVQHSVCFVTGHGERAIDDSQTAGGLGSLKTKLEGTNYKTSPLSLLGQAPTPESCAVVVLASPQAELLPLERDRLAQYVAAGGALLVTLDPFEVPETAADFARYGVKVGGDLVIEADPYRQTNQGPTVVLLDDTSYDIHPITSKLTGAAILANARSVGKGNEVAGLNVQVIAHASAQSWAETSPITEASLPAPDPATDIVGNVPLVVAVEVTEPSALRTSTPAAPAADGSTPAVPAADVAAAPELPKKAGGKVVVYGDGEFLANELLVASVNQDLFLNAVAWAVGEEEQISIRPNEAGKGKLTFDVVTGFLTAIVVMLVVPGLTIIGAVGMWLRRRRM